MSAADFEATASASHAAGRAAGLSESDMPAELNLMVKWITTRTQRHSGCLGSICSAYSEPWTVYQVYDVRRPTPFRTAIAPAPAMQPACAPTGAACDEFPCPVGVFHLKKSGEPVVRNKQSVLQTTHPRCHPPGDICRCGPHMRDRRLQELRPSLSSRLLSLCLAESVETAGSVGTARLQGTQSRV